MSLSAFLRSESATNAETQKFDLIVIGGGITGAGITLDATLRGLKVLLIEKDDFAFGTSSRSTKLIHGGLRYLKNLEFGLVKELGMERAVVHRIAPHLTIPEKMLTPIVKNGTYGKLLSAIGIGLYDLLAKVKKVERRQMLDIEQTTKAEPLLRKEILLGSALYYEYRTDDARLTIEIIKTAVSKGAVCLNYTQVNSFEYTNNVVSGVKAFDSIEKKFRIFTSSMVVNAAGPWVDDLRKLNEEIKGKYLHLTKGVHIVVPKEKLPVKQAVYFDVFDGRMIFIIPRHQITYIGTTDTDYKGNIDKPSIKYEDAQYLVKAVNYMLPDVNLKIKDIISGWAGLRPLIHQDNKNTSEISRKDEIFISDSQLISIAGGKLTGYRKMSEKVVDFVIKKLGLIHVKSNTDKVKLSGGNFENYTDVELFKEKICNFFNQNFENASEVASRLVHLYGQNTDEIIALFLNEVMNFDPEEALIRSELLYCLKYEGIQTISDFFIRRTGMVYFEPNKVEKYKHVISDCLHLHLNKSEETINKEKLDLEYAIELNIGFKKML
ncbi:MAG: glycerol-3-phosphate dehydrogenase/oxidase [Bacteroidota bacterium]|nr:glycerol-3-phosphate dehydrogenase/oxidase [Bacteroidota bacterium]